MGHSIGGTYSFMYDNTYEGEILGFIGLDNTPNNYEDFSGMSHADSLVTVFKIFDKYHLWGLLSERSNSNRFTRTIPKVFWKGNGGFDEYR